MTAAPLALARAGYAGDNLNAHVQVSHRASDGYWFQSEYRNDYVDIQACSDSAPSNGYNVGWTAADEFLSYTVRVSAGGSYRIRARVASANSGSAAGSITLSWDNSFLTGVIGMPATGGWQAWTYVDCGSYPLAAGLHTLVVSCRTGGFNLGFLEFTLLPNAAADAPSRPAAFALSQNYPNPFNPSTTIGYEVPVTSRVRLSVYDVLGREVALLADGLRQPGSYRAVLDGSKLSTGVYYCRLTAVAPEGGAGGEGGFVRTKVMTLTR